MTGDTLTARGSLLIVEDETLLRVSIEKYLGRRGFVVEAVDSAGAAIEKLRRKPFDLLVTDLMLSDGDGLELSDSARSLQHDIQIIVITGRGSKESVIKALRQGVWDYIEKPFDLELLLIAVGKALEKKTMERELVRLSRTDGLTGLFNQRYFYQVLEAEMKRAARQNNDLSLLLVDVDDFKQYNDLHGHLAGDEALVGLAACLREACRRNVDVPFRYGGDEFVVILPEADREVASVVANRIGTLFREKGLNLSLSIGVNDLTAGRDLKEIIRDADQAMYRAKQSGGNRAVAFDIRP